jgi:hypothetical protein
MEFGTGLSRGIPAFNRIGAATTASPVQIVPITADSSEYMANSVAATRALSPVQSVP